MDMGSLLGTIFGIILGKKRDSYVHCKGSPSKANIDSISREEKNYLRHSPNLVSPTITPIIVVP